MPFSKCARVSMRAGVRSSHTICTMRRPQSVLMRMWVASAAGMDEAPGSARPTASAMPIMVADRKSTRLNSSHLVISYAVFCLKKKNLSQHDEDQEYAELDLPS